MIDILILLALTFFILLIVRSVKKNKIKKEQEKQEKLEKERLKRIEIERLEAIERAAQAAYERERVDKKRKLINAKLNAYADKIKKADLDLQQFLSGIDYISNNDIYNFKKKYNNIVEEFKIKSIKNYADTSEVKTKILNFLNAFSNLTAEISKCNDLHIKQALINAKYVFNDIDGISLDISQREAIIKDEDNSLIVAGAGCGKTTTIAGKVKYLTKYKRIKPDEILLISYTKASALDMENKVVHKLNVPVKVNTFHKLGLDIIAQSTGSKPSVLDLSQAKIIEQFALFIDTLKSDKAYQTALLDFWVFDMIPNVVMSSFTSNKDYQNYLKTQKCVGLRYIQQANGLHTYREKFKSQEEVMIANFLFINNIDYKYEDGYAFKTASKEFGQYKPDFYLPRYDIYIEHFGIDKNGNVPSWFNGDSTMSAKEKYNAGIKWKRELHEDRGTILVESFSWEHKKGILLSNLKRNLTNKGVVLHPMTNDQLSSYLQRECKIDIDDFTRLLHTFSTLLKSNNVSIDSIREKASSAADHRMEKFLDLFEPVMESYEDYLISHNVIDFSDMINMATKHIENNNFDSKYKYIIIDEFQDTSLSRSGLIQSLIKKNKNTKLFCVGDDWQSIFRFAGSDIGLFTQFESYFEKYKPLSSINNRNRKTIRTYIGKTYRFDNKMAKLSSKFILKNPNQLAKNIYSDIANIGAPITIYSYDFNSSMNNVFDNVLEKINSNTSKTCSILLLGRYRHDIDPLINSGKINRIWDTHTQKYDYKSSTYPSYKFSFKTVHSSKGLEADYVILLNGNSGKFGFPSEVADDPILNFLLSDSDHYPNGEERRLFYVALTRAKKHVFILSNKEMRSKFVNEIAPIPEPSSNICPWCNIGELIHRNGKYNDFYACNNYGYCNYTAKEL